MNQFIRDDHWQREVRANLLEPFYKNKAFNGRFIFADKGKLAEKLQKELAVDTIMQVKENGIVGIEEKIVRWPGYRYTAFALETMSCTIPGREKTGWMHYAQCDILLYCFEQENKELESYAIPFSKLRTWFFENDNYKEFKRWVSPQINRTECYIVPIEIVLANVLGIKHFNIALDLQECNY